MMWTQPSNHDHVTGYIIHYSGDHVGTVTASADSTSTVITGLTDRETYNISIEATSIHLSGESDVVPFVLGMVFILTNNYIVFLHRSTTTPSRRCDG